MSRCERMRRARFRNGPPETAATAFQKGQRVRVLKNYLAPLCNVKVGTEGVVTRGGNGLIGVELDDGRGFGAWLVKDGSGDITIEVVEGASP